jgi:O-methyltransferase
MKRLLQRFLRHVGIAKRRRFKDRVSDADQQIINAVRPYTMTTTARLLALISAVRYIVQNGIAGDFAECGVWRGGSMMAAALTLLAEGDRSRTLYLYDTFQGMTPPTGADVDLTGTPAEVQLRQQQKGTGVWCEASLGDVQANLQSTGYPADRVHYVVGRVEDTIPRQVSGSLALLRLDTDWYESTRHELIHLFPLLVQHGVLILDDYGHWEGAQQATDEFFAVRNKKPLLHRIDYSGRLLIKTELT